MDRRRGGRRGRSRWSVTVAAEGKYLNVSDTHKQLEDIAHWHMNGKRMNQRRFNEHKFNEHEFNEQFSCYVPVLMRLEVKTYEVCPSLSAGKWVSNLQYSTFKMSSGSSSKSNCFSSSSNTRPG